MYTCELAIVQLSCIKRRRRMKIILTYLFFFPGLALLQKQRGMPIPERELPEAPSDLIQEATVLHPYAEAAYTVNKD